MSETLLRVLVESTIRVSVVALVVAAMLRALQVRASSAAHTVWTAVLFAMLLMPVLPYGVPALPYSVPALPVGLIASVPVIDTGVETPPLSQQAIATPVLRAHRSNAASASPRPPFSMSVTDASSVREPRWQAAVVIVYTAGALILLCRLLLGWCVAKRVVSRARRIIVDEDFAAPLAATGNVPLCESNTVAVPVTIGVISPAIILPVTWRQWPGDTLDAVLAHEGAHVTRHDPFIGFLARLNCCIFWFHPLAWWLERKLGSTAEHACDDAAVHAVGEPGRYVEILIEMAAAVRSRGGRLSWQGVGMDGGRVLGRRIDRLLAGESWPRLSPVRKTVVATTCAVVIVLVAACQREAAPLHPLREPPSRTPEQAQQMADERLHLADREMPPQVAADLEASLKTAPDNLAVRERLLFFYWAQLSPTSAAKNDRLLAARRALVLWLIDHHPESSLAGSAEARMFPGGSDALTDPVGYDEAKRRWLAHAARPDASAILLANAANFFEGAEQSRAEMLLRRAQVTDPSGPWSGRLGRFFAAALVGRWIPTARQQPMRDVSGRDRDDSYADSVRTKLVDAPEAVLVPAAQYLLASPRNDPHDGLDRDLLAQRLLERALQFNPASTDIHAALVNARTRNRGTQMALLFSNTPRISMYDAVRALPEAQRFELLPDMALTEYSTAVSATRWDDAQEYVKTGLEISKKCAEEVLRLAAALRADPTYGAAVYKANIALGSLALHAGDRKAAVRYLRAASDVPVSEELAYSRTLAGAWPLLRDLLTQGERASVIEFLNRMTEINVVRRADLRDAAESIRRGEMPELGRIRAS